MARACLFAGVSLFLLQAPASSSSEKERVLNVWAMGEEGLRIAVMARKFEQENPGVKVVTQAIPWDAAHEKLLTAVVGDLPPDVSQMGTTWMAEFATLKTLEPLEPYIAQSQTIQKDKFFEGSWNTNVVGQTVYGVPWYVDTRVLFYRKDLLAEVGFNRAPQTWEEFKQASKLLTKDLNNDGKIDRYGVTLPARDWGVLLPFVWENGGDVFHPESPEYEEALRYYASFFHENLTPSGRAADMDIFQAFRTGFYPMFISGPWMVELIAKELPDLEGKWGVSMMPAKKKRTSFVGGSNLVMFRGSKDKEYAWKFIEFMSRTETQLEWHKLLKSLPSVKEAWKDPALSGHEMLNVFGRQMEDTQAPPTVPEWEQIANFINNRMEAVILGGPSGVSISETLHALDREVNGVLVKSSSGKISFNTFVKYFLLGLVLLLGLGFTYYKLFKERKIDIDKRRYPRPPKSALFWVNLRKSIPGYFFITPAVVILTLFLFIPVILSFMISLTDWNIYGLADRNQVNFVGLSNYYRVLQDKVFWKSLWNTLFFTGAGVPFTVIISLLCATALNEKIVRFKTFFRTAYFLPVVTTIVAVAVLWRWIYNPEYGILNFLLKSLSLPEFNWLSDPRTALASLILMAAWKNFGYNMVIFLAGLQSIPETLYESARIDGANAWQLFLHVTLPGLRTTMVFVVIMSTIGYLQFFAEPYVMTKGGPLDSTISIVLYMYNQGFKFFELGYASALAYILFGIIFAFTFIQMKFRKSGFKSS